jgi:hypothetical protein
MIKSLAGISSCLCAAVIISGCSSIQSPTQVSNNNNSTEAYLDNNSSVVCNPTYILNTPSMVASTYPEHIGNIEIVRLTRGAAYKVKAGTVTDRMEHLWWNAQKSNWIKEGEFGDYPTQSNCNPSTCVNLDDNMLQVVTVENAKLVHYSRYLGTDGGWKWKRVLEFANAGYGSPALICNNYRYYPSDPRTLEVIVKPDFAPTTLRHLTRKNGVWTEKTISLGLPSGEYVRSEPAMAQCLNNDIHLCFVTSANVLAHYIWRNGTWFRRDDAAHRITGIDNQTRPAVVAYGYSQVEVFARPQSDMKKIVTYYNKNNLYLTPDKLTVSCATNNTLVANFSATTLGKYEYGKLTQYVHFYYNENGSAPKCVHRMVLAHPVER